MATISGVQCPEGFLNLGPSLWINGELHEVAVKDMTWHTGPGVSKGP